MIIVQLTGGMGNQLFQYAAGKSLALFKHTVVKFDTSFFDTQKSRSLDLKYFDLDLNIASQEEIQRLQQQKLIAKIFQKMGPPHTRKAYREPFFHFDANFFSTNNDVYLKGNWQSEKYFKPFEKQVRNNLLIKQEYTSHLENPGKELGASSSVSVHIRRGDYLQQKTLDYHGILSKEYYNEAIQKIAKKVPGARFYFFSDDIEWVKENLQLDHPCEFISGKTSHSAIEDFYLMQNCRHHIIANSSFSWWAAWLNKNAEKIVVAPKQWFKQGPKDTYDLLPEEWIKI